jgi:biotin carboxyl carrier protein
MASHVEMLTDDSLEDALASLPGLYQHEGTPTEFWRQCIEVMSRVVGAAAGQAVLWSETPDEEEAGKWRTICGWPAKGHEPQHRTLAEVGTELAQTSCDSGFAVRAISEKPKNFAIAVQFVFSESGEKCVAVFLLVSATEQQAKDILVRLRLMVHLPDIYQSGRALRQARNDVQKFTGALDLMILVNAEHRFLAAALTTCNELTTRFHCDRISLGWLENKYVRIKAISRTEKFERKANVVNALELLMEEALEQNEEIVYPEPEDCRYIGRDHESFARGQGVDNVCSIPLRMDNEPVAVFTCERNGEAFTESELSQLRVCADQVARRLDDLHRLDRWFGGRWTAWTKDKLQQLVGVEHTWAKTVALIVLVALLVLCFGKANYRVEAPFVLHSDDVMYLPAPFQGYIERVDVRVGDLVEKGDRLLTFDTRDLIFQKTALLADQSRYRREMEKARAENALADMRVAEAQLQQTTANLALTRHRLEQATVEAPFTGVIVEGDLREQLGAPVDQGETLFKVAELKNLYIELAVPERDVHELLETGGGEVAFASQPELKFAIGIERIEPVADVREEGNVFVVRANFSVENEDWYRPGMTGIGKLDVGKRRLIWIFTHETIDFLRMFLWW